MCAAKQRSEIAKEALYIPSEGTCVSEESVVLKTEVEKLDLQIAVVFMLGARGGGGFLVIFRDHRAVSATDGADEMSFSQQHERPELQQKSNGAVFIIGLEAVKDENSKKLEELTAEQHVSGIVNTTGEKTGTADVTRPLPARSSATPTRKKTGHE